MLDYNIEDWKNVKERKVSFKLLKILLAIPVSNSRVLEGKFQCNVPGAYH